MKIDQRQQLKIALTIAAALLGYTAFGIISGALSVAANAMALNDLTDSRFNSFMQVLVTHGEWGAGILILMGTALCIRAIWRNNSKLKSAIPS